MESRTIDPMKIEADAYLPTEFGNFRVRVMVDEKGFEHAVFSVGLDDTDRVPLVRIHSECLTGDAFTSLKCDCGPQLKLAMQKIQEDGCGAILYMRQEGRGIGLKEKIKAYALQDRGYDTLDANTALNHPADAREYSFCAEMLHKVGVNKVNLMTNNPLKINGLRENGIMVVSRIEHIEGRGVLNQNYLATKAKRMGHILPFVFNE
ncbi:MAG: GTP cyclohydrolase II [Candidatus Poseidoniaceae archaeon]|uniref:GTP cyclohydrolase-2 n=1 Tax=uncultured Poseidoniia archaeon TaxID=1697135 RepID=A0A1B1TG59_9ARCH|nr:GTP cyclohydrolase II, RibA [uncultured Candidatus Thalassoarchaea sp.]|tara:strand:- start:1019 stop:1636 length:618 start_codon:yes stop_codon:yes gene_type:complete